MGDAVYGAGAQQLRRDPARKAARAAVGAIALLDRVADISGLGPSDGRIGGRSRAEAFPGDAILIRGSRRERAVVGNELGWSMIPVARASGFAEAVLVPGHLCRRVRRCAA